MPTISREFKANPGPQSAFFQSKARIVGYGGAMGGGKSRAFCELALKFAIEHPGIPILIARQSHTSIVETTRKTMFNYVLPPKLVEISQTKKSMGEDFIQFPNGSTIHFIGLDDPVRWFSAEVGVFMVDQAEECQEETILKIITRLRHPESPQTLYTGRLGVMGKDGLELRPVVDYPMAGRAYLSYNPDNPGHWLQRWFLESAIRTKYGTYKAELYPESADFPLGDAEFFFARATDNPKLPPGYIEGALAGLPQHLRKRYLDGLWVAGGDSFFDNDALGYYQQLAAQTQPIINGRTAGDAHADMLKRVGRGPVPKDKVRVVKGEGPLAIWKAPVRDRRDELERKLPPLRYVIGVDVASGKAADYTAMQVLCVETFEVVARFQGKLDPDQAAVEAYRLGRIYNDALIVPEITGGWGFSLEQELKRLRYPKLHTRRVLDRLTKRWTDKTGWDTTVKMRAHMLDTLERALRERELGLYDLATVNELGTFVMNDKGKPAAQSGCNDDLVTSLAIAVTVAVDMPRQLRRIREKEHVPQFAVTGW